jgi:hypothetical protein
MKNEGVKMAVTEQTKKFSAEWKAMDAEAKKPFEEQAVEDKKRYEKEKASYVPPEKDSDSSSDDKPKKKRAKKEKDPNAPKRNMNAYMFFMQDKRASVKEKNPGFSNVELLSALGAEWKKLSDKDKEPYNAKAAADKTRYENEMKKYKK